MENIKNKKFDRKISYLLMYRFKNKCLFIITNFLLILKLLFEYHPDIAESTKKTILSRCKDEKKKKKVSSVIKFANRYEPFS